MISWQKAASCFLKFHFKLPVGHVKTQELKVSEYFMMCRYFFWVFKSWNFSVKSCLFLVRTTFCLWIKEAKLWLYINSFAFFRYVKQYFYFYFSYTTSSPPQITPLNFFRKMKKINQKGGIEIRFFSPKHITSSYLILSPLLLTFLWVQKRTTTAETNTRL